MLLSCVVVVSFVAYKVVTTFGGCFLELYSLLSRVCMQCSFDAALFSELLHGLERSWGCSLRGLSYQLGCLLFLPLS
jgi:hypothetical protein